MIDLDYLEKIALRKIDKVFGATSRKEMNYGTLNQVKESESPSRHFSRKEKRELNSIKDDKARREAESKIIQRKREYRSQPEMQAKIQKAKQKLRNDL